MNESKGKASMGAFGSAGEAATLLAVVSRSSTICCAVYDEDLRYRAVNEAVAVNHGLPVEGHFGIKVSEVIGELAGQVQPLVGQVLRTGRALCAETAGKLPRRTRPGCWVNHFFPVKNSWAKARQVGVLAVEVTELTALDELCSKATGHLLGTGAEDQMAGVRELQASITEYKAALAVNLESVSYSTRDPQRTVELFARSIGLLDERIQALTSALASCFPVASEQLRS